MKIKFIKDHKTKNDSFKKNEVVDVTPNIAFGLIEQGIAKRVFDFRGPERNKMMTEKKRNIRFK